MHPKSSESTPPDLPPPNSPATSMTPPTNMKRGAFIVFEGPDRSGKTIQAKRCISALEAGGLTIAAGSPWPFPDRSTPTGKMLDAYLSNATDMDDRSLHLLFSANRWEKAQRIYDALRRGETVIVDRYAYSGVAYSVAKGLDLEWCRAADAGLPAPDLVVYMDMSFEVACRKRAFGEERYENEEMQRAVVEAYQRVREPGWRIVDAEADADTVFCSIMDAITPALVAVGESGKVATLWN